LNSPRCSRLTNDRDSRSSYPSILTEKDIPDEGNARRIDEHQTKSKNFQMSGSKNKRITNTKFSFKTKNQLGMNNSYDQNKWFNFDEARYSKTKSTMIGPSKLKQSRTRKNLDENIEPENSEKIININSSENFCPGIDKVKEKPESKWSFWNTLKNPIQWLGLKSSHTNKNVRQERLSAMKVIRSVCHRDQVESMFKGRSSIEEKEPKYFNYSKNDRENKYRKYANYADNWAGLDSSLDTPNKPKDNRSNTKPYKLPGEYISSFRYRSTSFQNSFSEPPSYYSKTGSSRETFSTQSKQKEEDINYAERALARKATRAKEFEKVYKESTEGGLKSPPIQEVAKRAYLKLDRQPQKEDRGTLAEQVRKYKDSQKINEYKNLETLNSDRGSGYLIEFT
jgi:hypothetical protein